MEIIFLFYFSLVALFLPTIIGIYTKRMKVVGTKKRIIIIGIIQIFWFILIYYGSLYILANLHWSC